MTETEESIKYILSIDGGGIRGIIPAMVLSEIERRSGKHISDIFDMMVGTSTGGIVVAALNIKDCDGRPKFKTSDVLEVYRKNGPFIFSSSPIRKVVSWFCTSTYSHHYLEYVLDQYFGEFTFENVCCNMMLPSYDVENNIPYFFKSWRPETKFHRIKDALRAATAAPSYFSPKTLIGRQKKHVLVDGAVFVNNPAASAYASAKKYYPDSTIVLLSLGTGRHYVPCKTKNIGKLGWLKPFIKIMFSASLDAIHYQLNTLQGEDLQYIRIQPDLQLATSQIDDVTPKNMKNLELEGIHCIEQNDKLIDQFVKEINKRTGPL